MKLLVALVALATVALVAPALAQDADGAVGIRLVDAPEDRRDDPRARTYIVDHLNPGDTISRQVEVSNTTATETEVAVYMAAAEVRDGEFGFLDGRAENELTDWSTISPSTVVLPAETGTQEVEVVIAVPDDAVDGERYGVIWAELPGSGGQANVVNRVGVRVYLSVGDGEEPTSDFTIDSLRARRDAEGVPVVETTVTNTGGRALDLSGTLELADGPGSLTAGPFPIQVGTTLGPGERAPATVVLDPSLPDGPWDATVTIASGREERVAEATITFPSEAGESSDAVAASGVEGQRAVLLPVAAGVAALVAVLTAVAYSRRRAARAATRT